jgi:hypothetical protein
MAILATAYPVFQPAMRIITAITNASPASVTTSFDHQYRTGTVVRLNIPTGFGMVQANQLTGTITVTSDTSFTIPIDTTYFDVFAASVTFPYSYQSATVVPIGEDSATLLAATVNVLPYS